MNFLALPHDTIILDACCAINLFYSGQLPAILAATGKMIAISSYVYEEELLRCDFQPLVRTNQISIISPELETEELTEELEELIVDFAMIIEDGEAYTGAIAAHYNWAIASDERKVLSVFASRVRHLGLVTTPDFIENWARKEAIPQDEVRIVLQHIQTNGHYKPSSINPLFGWWQSFFP